MERLTSVYCERWVSVNGSGFCCINTHSENDNLRNAIVRLAAYEDTGLAPDEVAELAKIVRCKDCKQYVDAENHVYVGKCVLHQYLLNPDDFCSYGEKKGE